MEFEPISLCNEEVARAFLCPLAGTTPHWIRLPRHRISRAKRPWPQATWFKSAWVSRCCRRRRAPGVVLPLLACAGGQRRLMNAWREMPFALTTDSWCYRLFSRGIRGASVALPGQLRYALISVASTRVFKNFGARSCRAHGRQTYADLKARLECGCRGVRNPLGRLRKAVSNESGTIRLTGTGFIHVSLNRSWALQIWRG